MLLLLLLLLLLQLLWLLRLVVLLLLSCFHVVTLVMNRLVLSLSPPPMPFRVSAVTAEAVRIAQGRGDAARRLPTVVHQLVEARLVPQG